MVAAHRYIADRASSAGKIEEEHRQAGSCISFHLDPLEVVVQGGVHVEAVRPVREAKAQVCRLPPLHHFDHKIPGVRSANIVLLRNEQTHNKIVNESERENILYLLESATD